jgi:hypothetical protein
MKTTTIQQYSELVIRAFQSHHFMENPKPEIPQMKDLASFGQENQNQNQNDENSNNPPKKKNTQNFCNARNLLKRKA